MSGAQEFEGDILLVDTPDGGDIRIENGTFARDRACSTAIYLSLFGGNKDDSGKVKNKNTWWGNTLGGVSENEKLVSRFQAVIFGTPMTTKTILEAEDAARLDLQWIIEEGIADAIEVSGEARGRNQFLLYVHILANGASVAKERFIAFWEAGVYGTGRI
ncbi:MAG: phage GP46 family protein [Spirochaetota bacterium]|jgi:phage gp46-like protein|nr:phage GP46 family protein [Spirochaetota bacterium]